MKKMLMLLAILSSAGSYSMTASTEIICFEGGTCIDVGDVGVHP